MEFGYMDIFRGSIAGVADGGRVVLVDAHTALAEKCDMGCAVLRPVVLWWKPCWAKPLARAVCS